MSTLDEIEAAVDQLPPQEQERLLFSLTNRLATGGSVPSPMSARAGRAVLDIEPVSAGKVLLPLEAEDDVLEEMREGRA